MVVADSKQSLTITGNGDVLEPHDGVIGAAGCSVRCKPILGAIAATSHGPWLLLISSTAEMHLCMLSQQSDLAAVMLWQRRVRSLAFPTRPPWALVRLTCQLVMLLLYLLPSAQRHRSIYVSLPGLPGCRPSGCWVLLLPDGRSVGAAEKAMTIAADVCIYTNHNFTVEALRSEVAKEQPSKLLAGH